MADLCSAERLMEKMARGVMREAWKHAETTGFEIFGVTFDPTDGPWIIGYVDPEMGTTCVRAKSLAGIANAIIRNRRN